MLRPFCVRVGVILCYLHLIRKVQLAGAFDATGGHTLQQLGERAFERARRVNAKDEELVQDLAFLQQQVQAQSSCKYIIL